MKTFTDLGLVAVNELMPPEKEVGGGESGLRSG